MNDRIRRNSIWFSSRKLEIDGLVSRHLEVGSAVGLERHGADHAGGVPVLGPLASGS